MSTSNGMKITGSVAVSRALAGLQAVSRTAISSLVSSPLMHQGYYLGHQTGCDLGGWQHLSDFYMISHFATSSEIVKYFAEMGFLPMPDRKMTS